MASKKNFEGINTDRVSATIAQSTSNKGQQAEATPTEKAERAAKLKTQGRKGCQAIRINMAFTPENHEYIKVMAKITGRTMTEFANLAIQKYREEHPDLYTKAKEIIDQL